MNIYSNIPIVPTIQTTFLYSFLRSFDYLVIDLPVFVPVSISSLDMINRC